MKKLSTLIVVILLLGSSAVARAATWTDSMQAAIKNGDYNQINTIAAAHPGEQGAIAVYLLQQSQAYGNAPAREARIFATATPFVSQISPTYAGPAGEIIGAVVKTASDNDFQKAHPRETSDIFINALNMSSQPNIAGSDPNLHAEVLDAADDFIKGHPQDVDKRLLEMASLAETGGAPPPAARGVVQPSPASGGVTESLNAAIANGNFNQINVIGASHPGEQGAIAVHLLQQSQTFGNQPTREVRVFAAATPFVGRIPPSDAGTASEIIGAMLKLAEDKNFQNAHPREAADIFLNALNMSSQPNIVAYEPNLHAEVLEAANDFIKEHPQDADKRLKEEVSLAEAGGAPETPPKGVINPSAE